jgi:hypothetical protein
MNEPPGSIAKRRCNWSGAKIMEGLLTGFLFVFDQSALAFSHAA